MNFAENNVSIVSSRPSSPLWFDEDYSSSTARKRLAPAYLHGAHIERTMGLCNVSANYVNTYTSNSAMSRSQNSLTGTLLHDGVIENNRIVQLAV